MQLTLIVRKSGSSTSHCTKTVESFKHKDVDLLDIIFIDKLSDIDYGMIKSDWWMVICDDEMIEKRLLEAMMVGSKCENFDAFAFYKIDKETKVSICPRMFRKDVRLEDGVLYPQMPVRMETLLDGWVMSQE
jgi:hypothetical protein